MPEAINSSEASMIEAEDHAAKAKVLVEQAASTLDALRATLTIWAQELAEREKKLVSREAALQGRDQSTAGFQASSAGAGPENVLRALLQAGKAVDVKTCLITNHFGKGSHAIGIFTRTLADVTPSAHRIVLDTLQLCMQELLDVSQPASLRWKTRLVAIQLLVAMQGAIAPPAGIPVCEADAKQFADTFLQRLADSSLAEKEKNHATLLLLHFLSTYELRTHVPADKLADMVLRAKIVANQDDSGLPDDFIRVFGLEESAADIARKLLERKHPSALALLSDHALQGPGLNLPAALSSLVAHHSKSKNDRALRYLLAFATANDLVGAVPDVASLRAQLAPPGQGASQPTPAPGAAVFSIPTASQGNGDNQSTPSTTSQPPSAVSSDTGGASADAGTGRATPVPAPADAAAKGNAPAATGIVMGASSVVSAPGPTSLNSAPAVAGAVTVPATATVTLAAATSNAVASASTTVASSISPAVASSTAATGLIPAAAATGSPGSDATPKAGATLAPKAGVGAGTAAVLGAATAGAKEKRPNATPDKGPGGRKRRKKGGAGADGAGAGAGGGAGNGKKNIGTNGKAGNGSAQKSNGASAATAAMASKTAVTVATTAAAALAAGGGPAAAPGTNKASSSTAPTTATSDNAPAAATTAATAATAAAARATATATPVSGHSGRGGVAASAAPSTPKPTRAVQLTASGGALFAANQAQGKGPVAAMLAHAATQGFGGRGLSAGNATTATNNHNNNNSNNNNGSSSGAGSRAFGANSSSSQPFAFSSVNLTPLGRKSPGEAMLARSAVTPTTTSAPPFVAISSANATPLGRKFNLGVVPGSISPGSPSLVGGFSGRTATAAELPPRDAAGSHVLEWAAAARSSAMGGYGGAGAGALDRSFLAASQGGGMGGIGGIGGAGRLSASATFLAGSSAASLGGSASYLPSQGAANASAIESYLRQSLGQGGGGGGALAGQSAGLFSRSVAAQAAMFGAGARDLAGASAGDERFLLSRMFGGKSFAEMY